MSTQSNPTAQPVVADISLEDYQRAMLNILEDASEEKARLQEMQRAILNILEDSSDEGHRQEDMERAVLNILDDFAEEKSRLGDVQRAALNILDDFAADKILLEDTRTAAINILEDFVGEKSRLEEVQRAMLNLLDDFGMERQKAETANLQLQETIESLRRAKEAADAANRELEAFAYSVSHDLRAPLRSIAGFGEVLHEDYFDRLDVEGRDALKRIVAATEKMGQLIDDLLNLSRLTRAEMNRERHDLSEIVRKIAEAKAKVQPDRKIELVIQPGLFAEVDERLLVIVFENLLENAFKFTGKCESARIEFGRTMKDGKPTYFVRDNGTGFDMAYAGKLFQPFQRLHAMNEFPGTGIGLATVKRIIQRHNGTVWIEGKKDKGATIFFTL